MRRDGGGTDFTEFVSVKWSSLFRTAYLLTGEHALAEDLVQTALAKCYVAWPRLRAKEAAEAYVRKTMVNQLISWKRRKVTTAELLSDEIGDRPAPGDALSESDQRAVLSEALDQLPPRQRAVVVLRFYEDLDVAGTADVMGCSTGTVKSQTSDALANLKTLLGDERLAETFNLRPTTEANGRTA